MDDFAYPEPTSRRRWPRVAATVGVVAGLAVGATALAGAVTAPGQAPEQTTPTTAAPNTQKPPRPGPGRKGGPMGPGIHGEFVTPAPNGGYETIAGQVGTVTAVSSSSISVKSEDGFERTYSVDENTVVDAGRDGIADVKKDDQVRVAAIVEGTNARAVQVNDVTTLKAHRGTWAPPRGKRGGIGG